MKNSNGNNLDNIINLLRCPKTNQSLELVGNKLVSSDKKYIYKIEKSRIPIFFEDTAPSDTSIQKDHYNNIYKTYIENLGYPHTIEYTNYIFFMLLHSWMKEMILSTLSLPSRSDASSISSEETPSSFALLFRSFQERE